MQVDLGGLQPGVPQQFLNGGDRHARLGHVAAKCMAQLVAGHPKSGLAAVHTQPFLNGGDAQPPAETVEENGFVFCFGANLQPDLQGGQWLGREIHRPLPSAFAVMLDFFPKGGLVITIS